MVIDSCAGSLTTASFAVCEEMARVFAHLTDARLTRAFIKGLDTITVCGVNHAI
jgi:hypothetical protein